MFKVYNSQPDNYSYKLLNNLGYYEVILRENIEEQSISNYTCNEYKTIVESTEEEIENLIETNFDLYLENGKLNEELDNKRKEIEYLKKQLNDSDYQMLKCTESYMLGEVLPYNFSTLLSNRISLRDSINEIESNTTPLETDLVNMEKEKKIKEMMSCCQTTITAGIDYNNSHYRLNTTDQINLSSLYMLAQAGQSVPYHADGEVCRIFTSEEMIGLVQTGMKWVIYHTTYFNLLKHQIQEMESVEEIQAVTYGMELKEEYNQILTSITTE